MGTAAYTAPEVFSAGNVNERADVFGFAVLLWECLTGQEPWAECSSPMQVRMREEWVSGWVARPVAWLTSAHAPGSGTLGWGHA